MRIIFCAYREWAIKVFENLRLLSPENEFILVTTPECLAAEVKTSAFDVIMCAGWSWIIEKTTVENHWVVGVHPSDLPNYAGGSPIQNQIVRGVEFTKNTLFRLSPKLDQGPILGKVPLSLQGHMNEIFERLTSTSLVLFYDFIRDFPNVPNEQIFNKSTPTNTLKRLLPNSSRLTPDSISQMTTRELYNFIRCREDPYPNAFIEDSHGKLLLKICEFEEKK
jgi:methionyl-tRNA formyltransferase